jgi:uncharacterized protein YjbI with pentapeptide repeats
MADNAQLALLKEGVSSWNAWRAAHADMRPNLAAAHLCGVDLVGIDLAGADLREADLRGANLADAVLTDAHLEGANFFKAILDRADLTRAHLESAQFLRREQLVTARNWQASFRDFELACGAPIPRHDHV